MKTALNFSLKNKLINKKDYESIINHIVNSKLPSSLNKFFLSNDAKKILSFMLEIKRIDLIK